MEKGRGHAIGMACAVPSVPEGHSACKETHATYSSCFRLKQMKRNRLTYFLGKTFFKMEVSTGGLSYNYNRVYTPPGKSRNFYWKISRTWKVLKNYLGSRKSWKSVYKILESCGIC